jgi:dihydropyrimidinase
VLQKAMERNDFRPTPNGSGGVEDRISVLRRGGVKDGRLAPREFIRIAATNAARRFHVYPHTGTVADGSGAGIVVLGPAGTRWISLNTYHWNEAFSVVEVSEVQGLAGGRLSRCKMA